jgi:hypothetical protein
VTAVFPSFLTSVLNASPGALGVIEGTSDALLGVTKIAGAPLADDPRRRATLATSAIGLAATVWQAGVLRAAAWVARGVRSPAPPSAAWARLRGAPAGGEGLAARPGGAPLTATLP